MKNRMIQWLCRVLKGRQKASSQIKNFLIVSTTGLGDSLWASPAIKALRERYPKDYIALLTSPIGKELFAHTPHLSEIFTLQKPHLFSLVRLFFTLKKRNIDTIFLFHASQRSIFPLCALLGAKEFIGTRGLNKGLDSLFTSTTAQKPQHEIERRLDIVGASEYHNLQSRANLELFLSDEDEKLALAWLEKHQIPKGSTLIGLHPGAKDKFKQWPPSHFSQLGDLLQKHLGCQIVVTGNGEEKELIASIAAKIPKGICVCELPIRALGALMKRFSLVISNDTGPMHLAFAVQTPTVALFGPTNHKLCGPYAAKNALVIQKGLTCRPCLRKKCLEPFCLLQISVDEVYDAAIRTYSGKKFQSTFGFF